MGYRGEDGSRPWADSRRRQPWPPSEGSPAPAAGPRQAGAWDYEADAGYPSSDGYGVYEQGPRPDDHGQQNYGGPGRFDGPPQPGSPGRHGRRPGPGGPRSYPGQGGFPDNDWYGDSRSGGFADTSINARPSIPGGYRPGDYDTRSRARGPAPESAPPGPLHRPSPPGLSASPAPSANPGLPADPVLPAGPASYPGYENVDDDPFGNGGYQPQGGYDDYDDFVPSSKAPPTTANPVYKGPPPTTANPVPKEFRAGGAGAPTSLLASLTSSPKKIMALSASALCVIGVFAAIYFFLIKPSDDQANSPLPRAGSSSAATAACQKTMGQYCHITYRSGDPTPLSASELYPPVVLNKKDRTSFQRLVTATDKTCANAVLGSSLQSALGSKECSQAVRASYTSGKGSSEIVGTIGVFNLSSTNQAHSAGKLIGTNNLIKPLATSSGTGSVLGQSTGVMESQYKGHYLILTWAELASEATPTKSDDQKLQRFEADLIASTANISLSQRMVNGKPS